MIIYLASLFTILIIRWIINYFSYDMYHNHSKTSVPLLKTSFNLAFLTPEEVFLFPRTAAKKLLKSFRVQFFWKKSFEVCRAKEAEKILGSSKHIDKSVIYNLIHPFLKTGLLTSGGEKWHTRRRLLTPAFHFDILKEYFEVFREESDKLVESLRTKVGSNLVVNSMSTQFTLNTICESAMGVKLSNLGDDGEAYRENLYAIGNKLLYRLLKPWLIFDFVFALLGYQKELENNLKPVHEFTRAIIRERKANFTDSADKNNNNDPENVYFRKKRRYAMMDTLLQAESQGLINDEGIIEETDTFTFEGHDTTSAAMTFTLLLLAHHPEAQEKILEEMQDFLGSGNEWAINEINKMEYLDRVIKESLRIYPSVPFISRELSEDITIDGVTHPKGGICNIHIYDIHRDPEVYPEPEKFDPDRFLPENCEGRSNFAFVAFSAGMRNCIGQKFAMLELKVMLVKIISNFKILPVTTREEIVFFADLVLRPKNLIKIKLESRDLKTNKIELE